MGLLTQVTLTQRAYPAARTCPKCKGEWRNLIFHPYYCFPATPPHPNAPVAPKDVELVSTPRAQGKSSDPDQGKSVKKGRRAGNVGSVKTRSSVVSAERKLCTAQGLHQHLCSGSCPLHLGHLYTALAAAWRVRSTDILLGMHHVLKN